MLCSIYSNICNEVVVKDCIMLTLNRKETLNETKYFLADKHRLFIFVSYVNKIFFYPFMTKQEKLLWKNMC